MCTFSAFVRHLYSTTDWCYYLLRPFVRLRFFFCHCLTTDRVAIKRKYRKRLGYTPNLDSPTRYEEKINWLKLHDRQPFYKQCADKFAVRQFVVRTLHRDDILIPLYFASYDWRDVRPENFPNDCPYVLKCNHDNGSYHVVLDSTKEDWAQLRRNYRKRMQAKDRLYWSNREWSYRGIRPMILAEKYLCNRDGSLEEYKFYFYSGKLGTILFTRRNEVSAVRLTRYLRPDFTPLSLEHMKGDLLTSEYPGKPPQAEEMLSIAQRLAYNFPYHIRVDLYLAQGRIYVGELTFYDDAGYGEIKPREWEDELSAMLILT